MIDMPGPADHNWNPELTVLHDDERLRTAPQEVDAPADPLCARASTRR